MSTADDLHAAASAWTSLLQLFCICSAPRPMPESDSMPTISLKDLQSDSDLQIDDEKKSLEAEVIYEEPPLEARLSTAPEYVPAPLDDIPEVPEEEEASTEPYSILSRASQLRQSYQKGHRRWSSPFDLMDLIKPTAVHQPKEAE